jgi:DNA-binding SARP family transcriptional activator
MSDDQTSGERPDESMAAPQEPASATDANSSPGHQGQHGQRGQTEAAAGAFHDARSFTVYGTSQIFDRSTLRNVRFGGGHVRLDVHPEGQRVPEPVSDEDLVSSGRDHQQGAGERQRAGIRLLGPVELHGPRHEVTLKSTKERCLLAVLALDLRHGVSRDDLIDRVWGEGAPDPATLHSRVSQLRRDLAEAFSREPLEIVAHKNGCYRLDVDPELVDLHRFRQLTSAADKAIAIGDNQEAVTLLRQAVALWRGAPLTGISGDWLTAIQTSLEDERLHATTNLMESELRVGRHDQIIAELRELVARNPTNERLIGLLMLAHYRCGNQAAALACYMDTRKRIVDELGIDPSPRLQELNTQILRDGRALDWREGGSSHER